MRSDLDDYMITRMLIIILVCCVFLFYMEVYYLPHFQPMLYHGETLASYDLQLRDTTIGRFLNLQGVLWFCLLLFGGRELVHLLESLRGESDNLGCIGDLGGKKENESNEYSSND